MEISKQAKRKRTPPSAGSRFSVFHSGTYRLPACIRIDTGRPPASRDNLGRQISTVPANSLLDCHSNRSNHPANASSQGPTTTLAESTKSSDPHRCGQIPIELPAPSVPDFPAISCLGVSRTLPSWHVDASIIQASEKPAQLGTIQTAAGWCGSSLTAVLLASFLR